MQPNQFFSLEQVIDRQPITVSGETSLNKVISLMQEWGNSCSFIDGEETLATDTDVGSNNSCVLVVEKDKPNGLASQRLRGIFTERDLVKLVATGVNTQSVTVGEMMTQEVVSLTHTGEQDIFTALSLLKEHRIRHLPVVSDRQSLIGLITAKSLRQNLQPLDLMKWRTVAEIMETSIVHAAPHDSVQSIAILMANHNISCVAIAESEPDPQTNSYWVRPIGIITERDIVQFQNLDLDLGLPARNLMSAPLFLVSPQDSLWDINQQMQQYRVRRFLVANERGELQGIITQSSLLQLFDPTEMYVSLKVLQKQVCQLETEREILLQKRNSKLEQEVEESTAVIETKNQQLQHSQTELRQTHQELSFHVNNSPLAVIEWDNDFRVKRWSNQAEEIFGWQESEVTGKHWNDWQFVFAEDFNHVTEINARLYDGSAPRSISHNKNYHKSGSVIDCEWHNSVLLDESGNLISILSLVQDVSDRVLAQTQLHNRIRQQQAVAELGKFALSAQSLEPILDRAVNLGANTLGVEYCKILELQPNNTLLLKAGIGWQDGLVGTATLDINENSQAGYTLQQSQPVIVDDLRTETRFSGPSLLINHQVISGMSVVILDGAKPFGVLGTHTRQHRLFNQDDINFLWAIANIIAQANERQQAELKICQQASLLNVATDAIMVRELDDKILFWNQGAEKLYGWTKQETLNKQANELFYQKSKATKAKLDDIHQKIRQKGEWEGELNQITKAGKKIIVESRWTLVKDEADNPQSYLVVNTDITEQKQLEAQFLRTQRLESLGTLAGGIAHDLNNILAPILGFSRLLPLRLPDVDEKTKGFFKIIENNANRGSALVKQILTFARGLEGERGAVQIRHLIVEVGQIINQTFPKSIELVTNISKNLWTVNADVNQLHQVLMNLAVNARDAMSNGGTLTIDAENMTVDAEYARLHLDAIEGSYVLITVTDTGIGIPPEVIDRIFEPFFTTKEVGQGTGLGLSTVIGIIKSHGGFVDVASEQERNGSGTQFKVFLPASDIVASNFEETEKILPGNRELILVVDDETAILEVTKATLETYNYRVLIASNGIEAIATYAQNQEAIDLVIMDIMMPAMDGKTAILILKQINPELKIIAVSGLIDRQEISTESDGNVTAFLNKPYANDDLLRTISEMLS